MTNKFEQLDETRRNLAAAQRALPPIEDVESALREELRTATEPWEKLVRNLAAQVAGDSRPSIFDASGRTTDPRHMLDLAIGGLITTAGVDKLVKAIMTEASRLPPGAIRLDPDAKAEAIRELSHARYTIESEIAREHFVNGSPLPEDCHAGAVLGIPREIIESRIGLTYED